MPVSNKEIIVRHMNFTYLKAPQPALRDISFEIERGTVTAFVGQVGVGKSTLFKTLNGLIPAITPGKVEGEILVAGQDVRGKDPAFMAQFINLVFDDPVLQIVQLTAEEDVAFGPANLNLPREEVWKRVYSSMERVDLKGFEKRNPRSMSGGEQQLLALAGILAMRPRIIALDEPVAMLDPLGKARVLQAIRDLKESQGATILIAESGADIEAICEFADHMVLMDKGRILTTGKPAELLSRRDIVEASKMKVPEVTRIAWNLESSMAPEEVPVTLEAGRQWMVSFLEDSAEQKAVTRPVSQDDSQEPVPSSPGPESETAIEVKNLHHLFPGDPPVHALKGISLTFAKGDFVALLGQNGSGKTTLAFHLVGAEKPTNKDATIIVDGLDVIKSPLSQVVRRINYLFQNPANQLFCQTFGQEVSFGPSALGFSPEESAEKGRAALRQVGLDHLWNYYTLSVVKSLETLLSLASVLAMDPQILIADEPTGGLDYATGNKVMEILLELNRRGRTIIVITHDMELAAKYCRRVVVLRRGEVWMDGTPQEVFGQPERLAETRLSPPQVTLLAQSLARYGFPNNVLRIEEFVARAESALRRP
jgi:energy-coupling factor transporter ATP-binding protein EcfA2